MGRRRREERGCGDGSDASGCYIAGARAVCCVGRCHCAVGSVGRGVVRRYVTPCFRARHPHRSGGLPLPSVLLSSASKTAPLYPFHSVPAAPLGGAACRDTRVNPGTLEFGMCVSRALGGRRGVDGGRSPRAAVEHLRMRSGATGRGRDERIRTLYPDFQLAQTKQRAQSLSLFSFCTSSIAGVGDGCRCRG